MSDLANLLQQRLAQLEAGAPLEACLEGLVAEEAVLLRLAADIRQVYIPEQNDLRVAAQYHHLMQVASQETKMKLDETPNVGFVDWLRTQLDLLLSRKELAFGLASIALVILLTLAGWVATNQSSELESVAEIPVQSSGTEIFEPDTTAENTSTAESSPLETTPGEVATTDPEYTLYLPSISDPLITNPQTAVIDVIEGLVEVQNSNGTWTAVSQVGTATAGQRIRTRSLSKASVTFFDGSQAILAANTEISIDTLDAQRPENGFRTVVLTQWLGESDHQVQFRNDGGSRYEVKTPAGSGVARGTQFHVLVTPDLLARYIVTEGKVDVTSQNITVPVTAGQLTNIIAGHTPEEPVFRISGEGQVSQIGAEWVIAGQTFQTHDLTIIIGNPQVGDLVHVEGHLSADSQKVADQIVLLDQDIREEFTLVGSVDSIGEMVWTIAGQTIIVNEATEIEEGIAVGNTVRVRGLVISGGTLLAQRIHLVEDDEEGFPFYFTGVVQTILAGSWQISGVIITVDADTQIDEDILVGDVVEVSGRILEDGRWLARHIEQVEEDEENEFELVGMVQSIDPWQVAGISFETREWTEIEPGIVVGDQVRVRGVILHDGTWVAATVDSLSDNPVNIITFVGIVNSIDPWVVDGFPLVVNDQTIIIGDIGVGTLVSVQVQLLPDGTWVVLRIRPVHPTFGVGCLWISTVVLGLNGNVLHLRHWEDVTLSDQIGVQGNIQTNSVITLPICVGWNGTIIIVGNIIVIYQPIVIIINEGGGGIEVPPGCKITGIGNGNPHLKCSNKGSGSRKS